MWRRGLGSRGEVKGLEWWRLGGVRVGMVGVERRVIGRRGGRGAKQRDFI